MKSLLVTFGCSWTFGVGAGYQPGMPRDAYEKIAWDVELANKISYRGVLASNLNLDNISFAAGGSSNQKQFRLAKEFFPSTEFKELQNKYSNIIVLWAITSTARNEIYSLEYEKLVNFKYQQTNLKLIQALLKWSYSHDHEVAQLATEMTFWNDYFKSKQIKNLWIDTFNHHDYPTPIDNLIGCDNAPRDMLSQLALSRGMTDIDNTYHMSDWTIDSNRIPFLVSQGLLNPISNHPTELGHQQIANLLKPYIEKLL